MVSANELHNVISSLFHDMRIPLAISLLAVLIRKMVIPDLGALVLIAVVLGGGWLARRVLVRETQARLSHGLQLALFLCRRCRLRICSA